MYSIVQYITIYVESRRNLESYSSVQYITIYVESRRNLESYSSVQYITIYVESRRNLDSYSSAPDELVSPRSRIMSDDDNFNEVIMNI